MDAKKSKIKPSHGENTGSIPVGVTSRRSVCRDRVFDPLTIVSREEHGAQGDRSWTVMRPRVQIDSRMRSPITLKSSPRSPLAIAATLCENIRGTRALDKLCAAKFPESPAARPMLRYRKRSTLLQASAPVAVRSSRAIAAWSAGRSYSGCRTCRSR